MGKSSICVKLIMLLYRRTSMVKDSREIKFVMVLDYNIYMEVAVIPLDIALYAYLWLRYTNMTKINVAFRRFAFVVMIADIFDVATAIVTSAHAAVPNSVH